MPLSETDPIDQGEIFWITIPDRGGREQHGRRPCIVMSRTRLNVGNPIVVVPMTTETRRANAHNIAIPASEIVKDVASGSTVLDSVALCGQVFMVDKRKLEAKLGKLSYNAVLAVQLGLSYIFDIR
ncbi:MAG TPA: type II toxin-antitoxin system PemK/MazF family toxin [Terracidiphilus sp.]|jgi:mRNA-degrading endonuclease toxin of MazEF toxin-antitoxin module